MVSMFDSQRIVLESMYSWGREKAHEYRVPLTASLLSGIIAHFYAFSNKLVNFDEVGSLFNKGTTATSGRWGLDLVSYVFPDRSMPWIYGIISLVLLAISVCVIIRILQIRRPVLQMLVAGCVLTFPSLVSTISYMYTLSAYALSFLLVVLAVYFVCFKGKKGLLAGTVCLMLAVSIYQSYISIAASLLVLFLIRELLYGEKVSAVLIKGFLYVGVLAASLGLYYGITLLTNRMTGVGFNSYATERLQFSLSSLPVGIYTAYKRFVHYFLYNTYGLIPVPLSSYIHLACIAAVAVLLILWCVRQNPREPARYLLLAFLLGILPLAINCIFLFIKGDESLTSVHTLVFYSFTAVYFLAAIFADLPFGQGLPKSSRSLKGFAMNILTLGMAFTIVINTYIANSVYLNLHLRYENAYAFYSALFADIKMMPEFNKDTQIAIVGEFQEPYYFYDEFPFTYSMMGTTGFRPDSDSKYYFAYYYLGVSLPFADQEVTQVLAATQEVQQMPLYPYYGSMKMIDNILVVKLS